MAKEAEISIESNKISTGEEIRNIKCEAAVNFPEMGKKTVYRMDTGEAIGVHDMTFAEIQRELDLGDKSKESEPKHEGEDSEGEAEDEE